MEELISKFNVLLFGIISINDPPYQIIQVVHLSYLIFFGPIIVLISLPFQIDTRIYLELVCSILAYKLTSNHKYQAEI